MPSRFSDYPRHVETLVRAALAAADPQDAVRRHLRWDGMQIRAGEHRIDLGRGRLLLAAVGKAAVPMTHGALAVLGQRVAAGLAVTKIGQPERVADPRVETWFASHPISDERSLAAAEAMLAFLEQAGPQDTILFLISGGASALLSKPRLPLARWQALTADLLASGCSIQELNAVRRQLDAVKSGGLLRAAGEAAVLSLILSDVVGNPVDKIGSGPTVPSLAGGAEARTILARYRLDDPEIDRVLAAREPVPAGRPSPTVIVGDIRQAGEAAAAAAAQLGFTPHFLTWHLEGEAREAGKFAAALARSAAPGTCLFLGGETTVTLAGDGIGGRNLEMALAAALALRGTAGAAVATLATDGDDGPTGAAGAVITGETVEKAAAAGLDSTGALARNDSYTFFSDYERETGEKCLLITGQTGTNVNDLTMILRYDRS